MVFDGVASCGRKVEIDMHAKAMDQGMIDAALSSGQPVKISPKYWASISVCRITRPTSASRSGLVRDTGRKVS